MPSSARLHDSKFTFAAVGADDPVRPYKVLRNIGR